MMRQWFTRWFGSAAQSKAPTVARAAAAPAPSLALDDLAHALGHFSEVDTVFYRWLAGAGEQDAAPATEKLLLDALARLLEAPDAGADLVPRVPAVIPQLLRSLRDESVSGADLSKQLAQDVVLVAEVIREANSPYYHPSAPVRTIEGAVMLLGQNGLRMLLARVSFRKIISMQGGHFAKRMAPHIWSHSEKCAQAASLLAPGIRANPFEAYLASLMHNVGLIVALRRIDQIHAHGTLPQSDHFCAALFDAARALSSKIAGLWDFPATVAAAITQSGQPAAPPLAQALAMGDRIAKLRMLVDAGQFDATDPFVLRGLDQASLDVFEQLRTEDD